MPKVTNLTEADVNRAIEAGLRACDLYEVAKDDILSRSDLRKFLLGALEHINTKASLK